MVGQLEEEEVVLMLLLLHHILHMPHCSSHGQSESLGCYLTSCVGWADAALVQGAPAAVL